MGLGYGVENVDGWTELLHRGVIGGLLYSKKNFLPPFQALRVAEGLSSGSPGTC
jgi:hypothetical protein